MKKGQTLLIGTDGNRKINDGNLVLAFQGNRVERGNDQYQLETNLDWSFDDETTIVEIKSILGSFLSTIEDVFGEKMATEAILHFAQERNHLIKTPQGIILNLKSKGIKFKNFEKNSQNG